jgi:hypothetical protein
MRNFRLLKEDEIECRIGEIAKSGKSLTLLLYKTARTDAALLDEKYTAACWQNDFKCIDGKMYGGIGVTFDSGATWVWKWDCGKESNMEAEKGEASDAFKRAGFKWGIGTELYTAPKIRIPSEKCNISEFNGKYRCYDTFEVEKIKYTEDGQICGLAIINRTAGKRCFAWMNEATNENPG